MTLMKRGKNYETAIDIDPKYADCHYYLAKLLSGGLATNNEGSLINKKDTTLAIQHLVVVLDLKPSHRKACYNLGKIYFDEGKISQSKSFLNKAINLDPEYSKAHFLFGNDL